MKCLAENAFQTPTFLLDQSVLRRIGPQPPQPNAGEIKNMLRGELRDLDKELASASEKPGDRETRLHLEGIRAQIEEILEPKE